MIDIILEENIKITKSFIIFDSNIRKLIDIYNFTDWCLNESKGVLTWNEYMMDEIPFYSYGFSDLELNDKIILLSITNVNQNFIELVSLFEFYLWSSINEILKIQIKKDSHSLIENILKKNRSFEDKFVILEKLTDFNREPYSTFKINFLKYKNIRNILIHKNGEIKDNGKIQKIFISSDGNIILSENDLESMILDIYNFGVLINNSITEKFQILK